MTRRKEIEKEAFDYINSDVVPAENMTLAFGDFINGAIWADKSMIDRACKWLLNIDYDDLRYRDFCEGFNEELFVNDFRKAMLEEE